MTFEHTAELPELKEIIGQPRATRAIEFGIDIPYYGYNIFALGPAGAGKTTTIKTFLERKAQTEPVPDDWCYVNNFRDPYQPLALRLPPGEARKLRTKMDEMLASLSEKLPQAFESEEYEHHRSQIARQLEDQKRQTFHELESFVAQRGFTLVQTPMGLLFVPVVDGRTLSAEEYEQLSEEKKAELESHRPALQDALEKALRQVRDLEKETKTRLRKLDQEIAAFTIGHYFQRLREEYTNHPKVVAYLNAVEQDIITNVETLKTVRPEAGETSSKDQDPETARRKANFDAYRINVIVDHSETVGAPVVIESNPTYLNLVGRIEHKPMFGTLLTDFSMIKGGALHRANGGYLLLDARSVLSNPLSWDALKRALHNREIKIEEVTQQIGLIATASLSPEPIPFDVKVILIGDPLTYYLLYNLDEEFGELFKVKADFATEMEWTTENVERYACFVQARCLEENLPRFDARAVAKVVEHGARLAGDQRKLTTRFALITDLVREAAYWARKNGHEIVTGSDVQQAIDEHVYRANRIEELIREQIADGTLMVDTEGEVVGQVNGLSVLSLGDYTFGKPSRITAKIFLGQKGIINIEREAKMSGRIHDKGVLILSGYLWGKYAQEIPLSLSASLCFEQSYEGVEGDSASSTELYALLSSLSGLPVKQSLAVTGSVNQQGEIQPIGGVNEKIEGFFDVCRVKGLTGEQGVLIPHQNVKNLMLREDVVQAVREGRFHIYPIKTVDEGIALLTGVPAGERGPDGSYPEGTVNRLVQDRLRELALRFKEMGRKASEANETGQE